MVKDVLLLNGGQRNTFAYVTRSNLSKCFDLLKGSYPSCPVLKFGVNLSSRNRDMAQNVILYSCDLARSTSSVRSIIFRVAIHTLPMSIHVKFHWDPTGSFSGKLGHNLPKSGQEKEERRTLGETVWWTLTLCDANYTMKERSDVKWPRHDLKQSPPPR